MLNDLLRGKPRDITPNNRENVFADMNGNSDDEWDAVIEINSSVKKVANITAEHLAVASGNYNNIYEKISSGKHPDVRFKWYYDDEGDFYVAFRAGSVVYDGYADNIMITGLYVYGAKAGTLMIRLRNDHTFGEVSYTAINE